jgi:hypothetical protein
VGVTQVGVSRGWMEDNVLSSPVLHRSLLLKRFFSQRGKFYKHFMRSFCSGRFSLHVFGVRHIFDSSKLSKERHTISGYIILLHTLIFPAFSTLSHTFSAFCTLFHILSAFITLSKIKHRTLTSRCHETGLAIILSSIEYICLFIIFEYLYQPSN